VSLNDEIDAMLRRAQPRIGANVGHGSPRVLAIMRRMNLIGPNDGLTVEGLRRATALQAEEKDEEG
jgi:hypothetical protein